MNKPTKEKFLNAVKNHKLIIKYNNGLYRHIRMSSGTFNLLYEIITFPGGLLYRGDMGTYEFERIDDMFCFFRSGIVNNDIQINPSYWAEKVEAECKRSKVKEFSLEAFHENVKEYFRGNTHDMSISDRQELWQDIKDQLLCDGNEWEMISAMYEFSTDINFEFTDFWESSVEEYTYRFIWCLYAIVYAIKEYDKLKMQL